MRRYAEHWKKGWKVLLLAVCLTAACFLIVLPVSIIARALLGSIALHWISIAVIGVILIPAITHYIFELFYGHSQRPETRE